MSADIGLPGMAECCWAATASHQSYPRLKKSTHTDVAVVGAGIVGLTVAYALSRAGARVAVLEGLRVARQVTGRSSAKITSQHSLIYRHLRDTFNIEIARLYAEANRAGVDQIRTWVRELGISCDLEEKDAYAYTCERSLVADIEKEAEVACLLGFKDGHHSGKSGHQALQRNRHSVVRHSVNPFLARSSSGHWSRIAKCPLMTQSGHSARAYLAC